MPVPTLSDFPARYRGWCIAEFHVVLESRYWFMSNLKDICQSLAVGTSTFLVRRCWWSFCAHPNIRLFVTAADGFLHYMYVGNIPYYHCATQSHNCISRHRTPQSIIRQTKRREQFALLASAKVDNHKTRQLRGKITTSQDNHKARQPQAKPRQPQAKPSQALLMLLPQTFQTGIFASLECLFEATLRRTMRKQKNNQTEEN